MKDLIKLMLMISVAAEVTAQSSSGKINYSNYRPVTRGLFANFTYPSSPVFKYSLFAGKQKSITLKGGIFYPHFGEVGLIDRLGVYLSSVEFADVTGDGRKEAIIYLGTICDCTADFGGGYIYSLLGHHPRLLWAFPLGDRADGGLKNLYEKGGDLVVETFGEESGPATPPKRWTGPACCAGEYTRRRYRWDGRRFVQRGKAKVITL